MAQDNITNLYNALKDDYDLGSENDFRKSLENADNRHNLYDAIQNDYDLGSEDDFNNSLGYGNKQQPAESAPANNSSKQASFTQQEYGNLSTVAQDVAKGVGVAPKFDTQGTAQKIKEQLGGTKEKTQFVPEASNVVIATPTADALKKYPFLKADEAVPFNRETGEPFYTWVDENGKPLSQRDIDIRTAKQEITGEREYMQKAPAALELPDVNANAVKLDGRITDFVDNQMRAKYGDNYLDEKFKTTDGREVSGTDYLTELSQGLYDGLVNDVNNARMQYIDADDEQKNQIVTALADKYKGLVSRDTIESNMTDEKLQAEAKDERRRQEEQQLDEAYNNAYSQRAAVMGENMAKAQEDYNNASWLDKLFGGSPVQRAYWMNQNDNRIKIADTQINLVLDAKRVLDTGKAYDDGESWSGRFVRGMRDAMKDTGLYDGGIEEMNDLRNVKFALDAYESGNATNEQKDLLDTYALLQTITGENSDAIGRMYSAGQTTLQAIPFMLQMYINPIGSLGQSTAKAATQFALKQFGRSMMSKYMKRLLATSFKAGGRITGDMLAASLPAMTFGAPAIGADMYDRLIGNVKGVTDNEGNIEYSSREGQEKSKATAIAKAIGSNYFEYQSEMVGEYFRPLTNILSAGIGKATEKIGLGQINDLIANLSNKNFYRSFSDFAKRTQWQGTIGEYLEEVVNNAENALFIGDMDFSTGPNGVFNKDVNIDTFLGVAAMTGFMSSLKTADYIRTRGRIKNNLDNAYNNGLSLFGVDEWEKISNELDNIDENNAAKTVKRLVNSVDDNDMKQAIANYAAASAMNHGFNIGDLKNNIEEASDNIVNGKVPRSAILGFDSLSPDEQQNVHDDGMIHSAILYPIAENGGNAEQVFIVKGNVALNNDGSVDIKNSSDAIYYKGSDGQIHQVAPDKIQAADVPVSVEDYIAMKSETAETAALENEGTQTNTYSPGQVVNINVNGNNYEATVNSLDGNGNIMVYYQDENGIDRPATFTIEQLDAFNAPQTTEQPVEAQPQGQIVEPEQPVESNTEQMPPANAEGTAQVEQEQPAQQSIPTDEEGNPLYYNAPIEATINDLYDGSLNDEEIQGFIDANIQNAQKKYDSIQKKAPKIGTNKAKYLEQKREWQTNVDEAKRILDYWQSVDNYRKEQTHTTDADIQSAQAELSGDNARAEFDEYNDNGGVNNAVSVASDFIRGAKITPESFKSETGYGTSEQQKFVGMIAKEENGGKTIDRLAEELVSYDNAELNGVTYRGDTSLAKDAILEALQAAGTRGELAQNNMAEREKYVEARRTDLDEQYMEVYGMTYDEYLSYEEQIMPTIWRDYNNYDEIAFNNMYAEEIQQLLNTRENDTTGEKQADGRGNQVLPEQQSIEQAGSAGSTKPGTEIQAGVQSNNENAAPQEEAQQTVAQKIADAEAQTDTNPTEAQKEAGNYKKGHVTIDGYNITIEQPKGSVRRGTDANGKQWEQKMNNTYGYIRGTEGVDGDHIDIFLSDNPTEGNVYVVDQVNPDGSFDEHKVMYGFNSEEEARNAYLSNYEEGWQGLGNITEVSKGEFKKWVESSHRKTKPFAEYSNVKKKPKDNMSADAMIASLPKDSIIVFQGTDFKVIRFDKDKNILYTKDLAGGEVRFKKEYFDYITVKFIPYVNPSNNVNKNAIGAQNEERADNTDITPGDLLRAYESGDTKAIEYAESRMRTFIESSDDMKAVAATYFRSKDNSRKFKKDVSSGTYRTQSFIAEACKKALLKAGIPKEAFMGERKRVDFANSTSDARVLDVMSVDPSFDVLQAVVKNPNTSNSTLLNIADLTQYSYLSDDARQILAERETDKADVQNEGNTLANEAHELFSDIIAQSTHSVEINDNGVSETDNTLYAPIKVDGKDTNLSLFQEEPAHSSGEPIVGVSFYRDGMTYQEAADLSDAYNQYVGERVCADGSDELSINFSSIDEAVRFEEWLNNNGNVRFREAEDDSTHKQRQLEIINDTNPMLDDYHTGIRSEDDIKTMREAIEEARKKSVSSQKIADLFDLSNEPINNTNNETVQELRQRTAGERTGGQSSDTARPLGESKRSETEQPAGERVDTRSITDVRNDGERGERLADVHEGEGRQIAKNRNNNHAERGTDYAPTTPKARYDANVNAIRLAKELTDSGQQATDEQKAVLRQFSGWGGLGTFFNNERTRNELIALLGDDGYQQAAMSINSAYYTPADVIDTMWDIVKNLGFKGGNILEGSAGIGNILGLMPMDISDRSNIEAVEIDGVSGMILRLLYPDAKVDIQGFENTQVRNGSVDLAITNVPFVTGLHVHDTTGDRDLSRRFGNIHDFCIAKNVRKLREGGIGVFISSSGTLDKSKALRDWVVNEGNADFIGAFRLNNKTFGGTTATSDIIVVRKRINGNKSAGAIDLLDTESVRTVNVPVNDNGREKIKPVVLQYNKYFVDHPENMGGEMALNYERGETFRPEGSGLFPTNGINQRERMQQWTETFKDKAVDVPQPQIEEPADTQTDTNGNEIKDGTIVVGEDGSINVMYLGRQEPLGVNDKKVKGHTKAECVEDYNRIKRALNAVLEYETTNEKDDGLKPLLKELNDAYDSFKDKYGSLNKNTAISFLRNDIDFPSIQALEKFNETNDKDGKRIVQTEKTSIFTERVVQKEVEPHPTNVLDAVKTSVFRSGRIDLDYISNALGRDVSDIEKEIIDNGLGYRDPATGNMEVSYEYLSGNVRQKLAIAEANNEDGRYDKNINALRKVMPMDIPAHLIEFTFGSSWVNPKLFSDYVNEKTGVPVTLTNIGGQWNMDLPYFVETEKNKSEGVRSDKLHKLVLGTDLMNAAINNRTITVSTTQRTWDGKTETITDKEATQACAAKIDDIRNDFKDWARAKMQSDPELANEIERVYNDRFNNYVPVQVPDEFTSGHFPGASTKITLFPHQSKAVIRATGQPIMLAHEVGTGKTFTLITTAMEMRRLGLARKPMIVVQNATVGQFVASAKELYPNAKVLTIADNERNEEGRKRFYAKIKYNDWDMIVVPQSVFERIPDSEERQMDFINDRIEEKEHVLEQIQEIDPKSMIARNAKRELDSLQTELAEVSDKKRQKDEKRAAKTRQNAAAKAQEQLDRATDDVENFDDMEIDAVLVDEAHEYKHLGFSTAMQRGVKGVDPSYSKKSAGVYLKTRAVMEKSNGKNVVFATGTPISNTAAEIWTFMRYLMPKHTMEEYGIYYFDDFVRNFGNLTQMLEFTTSGKFKENNRFAGYVNIPELMRIWSSVSDTVLTKETNLKDKLPETVDGGQKATDIYLPQSASLRSIMKAVRAELERFDKMSGKEKKENSAIPLVMYGIAKAAAIDPRLVMAEAADEPVSKTNRAVEETLKSLEATKDYKGTVAIFCDTYQNNQTGFNIYEEIKRKLVERGVPENQIVIMRSGMSVNKKAEIFDKVNAGDVRVIMGSTFTLGTGVNIQERLNTLIHLDAPNRPMDYTQRNGRILRQGNLHKQWGLPVKILRFGVEDSLDITAYQRLKTKGAIADSVMEGKKFINNNQQDRTLEEQEDVFGDTVAQLSGSEYALLKNQAERDFRKYSNKKKQYEADQIYVHNAIPRYEGQIRTSEETVKQQQKALSAVEKAFPNGNVQEITIGNSKLSDQKAIGDYIKDVVNKKQTETEDKVRKGAQGTKASSSFTIKAGPFTFTVNTEYSKDTEYQNGSFFPVVHRNMTYSCGELGLSNVPVQRASFKNAVDDIMNNVLSGNDMRERIETENNSIERNRSELEQLKSREGKPFENEKELEDARKKVEEYTEKMRKEMEVKEQKYAEMDAQTQSADLGSLSGAEEAEEEELQRSGDGVLTDDELSYENDPVAKMTGRSTRTAAQRRAFAERERQRMMNAVQELAEKLHLDNVDIVTDASTLQGRRAKAKGFYSRGTGRITIVIPNHTSVYDVEQTLLHEAVAHYGLRQLFGEQFDTFLDNVYNNVDEDLKKRIDEIAEKRGLTTRVATEEYLATLAENTNFEDINASWWDKIKNLFLRMLHKIGFENFSGVTLSDNELRYILWRSYENLKEPGRYRSIIGEARDMSKQRDLNVGNYAVQNTSEKVADNDEIRYRESDDAEESLNKSWQDEYDERTLSAAFKFTEAAQDGMKSVSILQDVISKETGIPITEDENVWALQNRLSSTNKFYQDYYYQNYYKPLMQSVADLVKQGAKYDDLGRDIDKAEDDILKYVISKHGLERNEHFREQKARDARVPYQQKIDAVLEQADKGEINQEEADDQIKKLTKQADKAESRAREKYSKTDFSGLSELYKTGTYFEALAENYVQGFESKFDTSDLWNKINAATKATLKLTYESGLMSRAAYEATRDMYQNYIPLRGWSNDVASDMYNYKGETGVGGRIVKRAKGRKSLAENPLAVIGRMGQDGILQANKNRVKQRLYNLAVGHDTSLLTVSKQWYVNEGTDENPEWERAYPELGANMNADEVADALEEFDERMKELKEQGRATQRREGLNMKYHTSKPQEQQHRVNVSIGGREYNIYVNGNPRAAQAINGELRMDEDSKSIVQAINRFLANVYTSLNPEFIVTNYERDAGFAGAIVAATEDSRYVASWTKNMAIFNPLTSGVYINNLINKATKGTVDLSNKNERYMQEFLANGGETGFTNMLTADDYKKIIKKEIKEINKPIKARQAANAFMEWAKRANRVCEDATRFATYVTSREQGRSIDRAIRDAKEISLNFNTRGADGMANDGIIHKLFRNLRRWIIFTNPSIQGLNKAGVAFKNHPVRSTIVIAGLPTVLGYMVPALAAAILGDDDDKEAKENYMDLPKWVRRTNICLPMGGTKFITIPLSYELRVSYGLGEMLWEIEQGQAESGELVGETLTQLSDLLPISFASGTPVQNLSPTTVRPIIDLIQNKDFTGRPIYKENTYNQGMPEFTKVYAGTSKWLVKSAEVLNNAIPQFWNKDYAKPDKYTPGAININPAKVEYLLSSYFGGLYTFPTKVYKTASMLWDEDMRDIRNIPFINRNLKDSQSGNPVSKSAGDRYNTYMKEYNLSKQRWNGYKREVSHGVTEFLPSLTDFTKSAPGQRMFIIDSYKKSTDELNRQIKYMKEYGYGTEQDRKDLQQLSDSLKKELVEKLDSVNYP